MRALLRQLAAGTIPAPTRRAMTSLVAGTLLLASIPVGAQSPRYAETLVGIDVRAEALPGFDVRDPSRQMFGALQFRGGLVLSSSSSKFGGLSAIRVARDGAHFLAVTDQGSWLRARIVYDGTRPVGIADAEIAPILGSNGRPLASRGWYDAESLAEDGGAVYVGLERVNRIVRFDFTKDGLAAHGRAILMPPAIKSLPNNKGLEALVAVPKGLPLAGTLIALSERAFDEDKNIRAFLIGGPTPGEFSVRRSDDYDISDAALLPGGDFLILERRYSPLRGVAIRIRRVPLAQLKPGATVDGRIMLEADMGYQIDNMEGLSVHRTNAGEIVLTLISDDNFSPIQRTLLLQFTLVE